MNKTRLCVWLCLLLLFVGLLTPVVGQAQEATATDTPTVTDTPTTTSTPTNTATASPTNTLVPTETLAPTATLEALKVKTVEPRHLPSSTGGVLTVLGTGFTAATTVRLEGFGLLEVEYVNSTALKAKVPVGVAPNDYRVRVIREDGAEVKYGEKIYIDASTPEPTGTPLPTDTPAPTAEPTLVPGRPQLVIEGVYTTPADLVAGVPFSLTLTVANRGNRTASTGLLSLTSDAVLSLSGSNAHMVGVVRVNQTVSVTLSAIITGVVQSGYQDAVAKLEYTDYQGDSFSDQQTIWLEVTEDSTRGASEPRVILAAYYTDPPSLAPGDTFTLTIEVSNVGGRTASNLNLTLGGASGSSLKPFALLSSGNVKYIPALEAGQNQRIDLQLLLDGTSDSGVYSLPVEVKYEGAGASSYSETQVLNLIVQRRPQLRIGFYRTLAPAMVGQPMDLPVEVVNLGRKLLNVGMIEVSSSQMQVEQGSVFMGPLEGGTSGSLDAIGIPMQEGVAEVLVTVNYLDDFNQQRAVTQTLTVDVQAMPEMPEMGPGNEEPIVSQPETPLATVWRFIRGLLGLGS